MSSYDIVSVSVWVCVCVCVGIRYYPYRRPDESGGTGASDINWKDPNLERVQVRVRSTGWAYWSNPWCPNLWMHLSPTWTVWVGRRSQVASNPKRVKNRVSRAPLIYCPSTARPKLHQIGISSPFCHFLLWHVVIYSNIQSDTVRQAVKQKKKKKKKEKEKKTRGWVQVMCTPGYIVTRERFRHPLLGYFYTAYFFEPAITSRSTSLTLDP